MKRFWLILSLYLFSLSVFPCSENLDCDKKHNSEIETNHKSEPQKHETEHCTPFCICTHCSTVINFFEANFNLNISIVNFQEKKKLNFHTYIYIKNIVYKIWQPPKISL